MISWLQRMQAISPNVTLFGSVWSPPLWMKSNLSNDLLPQFFQAWVGYIMQYLASYEARGVDVAAITMQACRTTLSAPSLSIITPLPPLLAERAPAQQRPRMDDADGRRHTVVTRACSFCCFIRQSSAAIEIKAAVDAAVGIRPQHRRA